MANYRDSHIFVAGGDHAHVPDDSGSNADSNEAESGGDDSGSNADNDKSENVGAIASVDMYTIETDTWITAPALPDPRNELVCCTLGDYLYVIGGYFFKDGRD